MSSIRTVMEVARWEFLRFFKMKEQIVTFTLIVVIGVAVWGIGRMTDLGRLKSVTVAVVAPEGFSVETPPGTRIRFEPRDSASILSLTQEVDFRRLDGLLVAATSDSAVLRVGKVAAWQSDVETAFRAASKDARLRRMRLSAEEEARLARPAAWTVDHGNPEAREAWRAGRLWSVLFIVLTLMGLYIGNAYLFVAITGEKRLHVTEQVLSAITPQTWIDGKILGLSGVAAASTAIVGFGFFAMGWVTALLNAAFGAGVADTAAGSAAGGASPGPDLTVLLVDPMFLLVAFLFAVLGFFFWFTLFAAVASTINDPNTSGRTVFLFVPMIPASICFMGLKDPDSPLMRMLGILPFSSHAALPVRLAMGGLAPWEIPAALAVLTGSIWLLRRAAGKVFALGMLLYGKEPRWSEMWRWIREA
ncbi:MAG: ABC transporter permease [Candidatus Eisenbacteria bacterium]